MKDLTLNPDLAAIVVNDQRYDYITSSFPQANNGLKKYQQYKYKW